jgi:AcrR family transcriptional regulator
MAAKSAGTKTTAAHAGRKPRQRLPYAERRRNILDKAAEFFAEHGLAGQTRSLAHACAISQRLLYRFFPSKAALLDEVYEDAILGPFRTAWLVRLADRREPVEQRLNAFYCAYFETVLTRRWLRLFLHSSLANRSMAPGYNVAVVMPLLERIVEEVAHEQGLRLPDDRPLRHELGWTLHGAVSHLAIRKHLYHASQGVAAQAVIALHVRSFLGGFAAMVATVEALRKEPQPAQKELVVV